MQAIGFEIPAGCAQIYDNGHALPYAGEDKTTILIAAKYSTAINNIDTFIVKRL